MLGRLGVAVGVELVRIWIVQRVVALLGRLLEEAEILVVVTDKGGVRERRSDWRHRLSSGTATGTATG